MSIDKMRVAAVNYLLENGHTFSEGKWVPPAVKTPEVTVGPFPVGGRPTKCGRRHAAQLWTDLRYHDPKFAKDFALLSHSIEQAGAGRQPSFNYFESLMSTLEDAFLRNSVT